MSRFAAFLARLVWGWSLWLMRRPWMKRLQRGAENLVPERRRPSVRASTARQNRFARRYGLGILTVSINLLLASMALTACFYVALYLVENGSLTMSSELRERVGITDEP
jgi:hypothetical protein